MKKALLIFSAMILSSSIYSAEVEATDKTLFLMSNDNYRIDFTQTKELAAWRSTNDGVMGGRSLGSLTFKDGSCVFSGNISLENNGGFSSVFKNVDQLSQGLDTISINMIGDGSTYQFRITGYIDGYRLTYKHDFGTTLDKRENVKLSLKGFKASFRGRLIQDAPVLKSEDIREVGFLITRKVSGEFNLQLLGVEIYELNNT